MSYKEQFCAPIARYLADDEWLVAETGYDPNENLVYESVFCLASGSMGNRASHEEGFTSRTLPANYLHGVFDKSEAFQRELCNTPDWCKLKMYFECDPIGPEAGKETMGYLRVLDMRHGLLAKRYLLESRDGRQTRVETLKFLSRVSPHCGAFRIYVTPLNYGGILEFENIIDATVTNFMDFPRFRVKHLDTREVSQVTDFGAYVQSETRDFKLQVGSMTTVKLSNTAGEDILKSRSFKKFGEVACEFLDARVAQGETVVAEKYAAVISGKDCNNVREGCESLLRSFCEQGFDDALRVHIDEYARLWQRADLRIAGDDRLQQAVRFNIFHLMSTPNPHDNRTNIGAKLIHGEEYGGHAFWDTELFILPFFDYVFPETARKLVEYRYLLLDKARENARTNGYLGAKYPWESADTGDEECPAWTIEPDGSCYRCYVADYEHHVTAAVAYGAMKYYEVTGDVDFWESMGLEIFVETARFWVSRLEYNSELDRYEITKVTGPDEWHEPVDNNAYTNHLARWNIVKAVELCRSFAQQKPELYAALVKKIGLCGQELDQWLQKVNKLYLRNTEGLIEQFDGYFELADAVVDEWDDNGMPLLPQSLKPVAKEQRCILKQADVVMLMFLLDKEFSPETQKENFSYYEPRTLHRSSLSPSIHALMGLRVGESSHAYRYLERSAYVDIQNNQRNTREGIHAASAGGTWQCITLGYCGMSIDRDGVLSFAPRLPEQWGSVEYSICWKGAPVQICITHDDVRLTAKTTVRYRVDGIERNSQNAC